MYQFPKSYTPKLVTTKFFVLFSENLEISGNFFLLAYQISGIIKIDHKTFWFVIWNSKININIRSIFFRDRLLANLVIIKKKYNCQDSTLQFWSYQTNTLYITLCA